MPICSFFAKLIGPIRLPSDGRLRTFVGRFH